ncbi:MAG: NAD dependent epimerase/dehydratase family protein [Candidatus Nomurabacteria bacterium GW2011_GWB1_37_5]|uniref:NAD dependent epimerase/dehydratase family protein n=1 Tax=Candidatus Nomurabacteria bacterium GW2011_GWB1_37_5 TaxID=1618742 RepID=A0A0G0JB62_9BACT|nr:MAG: NAD dependent epimerase/dehydratase family protein [Candidatus Nomurabacteria bacterium GW2011_GWB1_37_5]
MKNMVAVVSGSKNKMLNNKKNILILGGFGFIGKNLIEDFLKTNTYSLSILDLPGTSFGDPVVDDGGRLKIYHGNFSDRDLLRKIFTENNIDIVIHLVSTTIPATSNADIIYDIHSNLEGTISILEEMRKASVLKIVYFSSGGTVYGSGTDEHKNRGFRESDQTNPISSYGIMKLAIEKYLELYRYLFGINYLILRESNPYGPYHNSDKQGFINVILKTILSEKPVTIWGDGSVIRDFIYVKDTGRVLIDLLDRNIWNRIFNLGSGQGYSINEILEIIKKEVGDFEIKYESTRSFDVPRAVLDISELSKTTPVANNLTGIKEGILLTYKWLNRNNIK